MRCTIMTINAVHESLLACNGALCAGLEKLSDRTIVICFADPWDGLICCVCGDVLNLALMSAVNPAEVSESVPASDMHECDRGGLSI